VEEGLSHGLDIVLKTAVEDAVV